MPHTLRSLYNEALDAPKTGAFQRIPQALRDRVRAPHWALQRTSWVSPAPPTDSTGLPSGGMGGGAVGAANELQPARRLGGHDGGPVAAEHTAAGSFGGAGTTTAMINPPPARVKMGDRRRQQQQQQQQLPPVGERNGAPSGQAALASSQQQQGAYVRPRAVGTTLRWDERSRTSISLLSTIQEVGAGG